MHNAVEQIKERLNIVDVVGSYVQLQKVGKHFKGKSPFTNEKTPSFFVSPERGMYYCFSSGKGGDIFRFIEEMEGVDFKGALKMLAERAHVELTPQNPQQRTEREAMYALLDTATTYFESNLQTQSDAQVYVKKRGVSDHSVAKWRIGYVPDGWRNLRDHLTQKGFTDALMLRSGLIKHATEGNALYDVFRNRIMFPIADSAGRIVAFSGRTMSTDSALPKYVNSPETPLYQKSHILFGYHLAKQSIRTSNFSLIVEGQFDLVLAHQAGFKNTVAISGTALSTHHTDLLQRLSSRVVLALDADRAGINSVRRAAHIMLARDMDVKVAMLPEGKDPADLIAVDPTLFKTAVREALTVVEFLIAILRTATRDERAFRLAVRDHVLPMILRIPSRIDREHFEEVVSTALSTTRDAVHYEIERLAEVSTRIQPSIGEASKETGADRHDSVADTVPTTGTYRTDELVHVVYGIILWQEQQLSNTTVVEHINTDLLRTALKESIGEDAWRSTTDIGEQDQNKLIFETELQCGELSLTQLQTQLRTYLKEITERVLKRALMVARTALREAEGHGDEQAIHTALTECSSVQKRLSALGNTFDPTQQFMGF